MTRKIDDRLLLRGGFLYTADAENSVIPDSWLLIAGDRIESIGQRGRSEAAHDRVLDARGKMVLPGFVNAHWHESLVAPCHELPDDSQLQPTPFAHGGNIEALGAMFGFIASVGARLTEEEALAIARWSLWTQLRSGTTALGDLGSANTADAMAQAALDLGMRIRVSRWGSDIMIRHGASTFERIGDADEQARDWEDLLSKWNEHASGLIGGMPSVMGAFGSSDQQLLALRDVAAKYGVPYAAHLAPLRHEAAALRAVFGRTSVGRFEALGLLGERLLSVHNAFASDEELELMVERGVKLCHSPAHYGQLGESTISETRRLGQLIKRGVAVSSSTDGGITYVGGMPEAMRATHLGHNEALADNTACPPTTALRAGTQHGADALHWGARIGSLEPGKQADLVLVDIDDFRYAVGNHPLRIFLIAGSSKDVHSVFVAGRCVVEDGRSTQWDEASLLRDYRAAAASARQRIAG
jgi:cytosine/adenosine deaminase-related metal-dependent hydrolase